MLKDDRQFYQITVEGQLDPYWSGWFDGMVITWRNTLTDNRPAHETTLSGYTTDQPALYGMLNKLRDLNLSLLAVERGTAPLLATEYQVRLCDEQIFLVQDSFEEIRNVTHQVSALFFQRLFELAPEAQTLFHDDLPEQGRKFFAMLTALVNGLPHLELLLPTLQDLGKRHLDYGVQGHYYILVGDALLWALEKSAPSVFTTEVCQAWVDVYELIADIMQNP